MLANYRLAQLKNVQEEGYDLFVKKNADYGDAFANHGPVGVLVRLGDKIQRLQKITKTNVTLVKTESLRDTLIDLHNYAAMAIMLLDEEEKEEPLSDILDQGQQLVLDSQEVEDHRAEDQEEDHKYEYQPTGKCIIH